MIDIVWKHFTFQLFGWILGANRKRDIPKRKEKKKNNLNKKKKVGYLYYGVTKPFVTYINNDIWQNADIDDTLSQVYY